MTSGELKASIASEAERIRSDGTLPPGFEDQMASTFAAIAADPGALEAEVARQAAAHGAVGAGRSLATRAKAKAARLSRAAASSARARVGPSARRLERRGVEAAAGLGERVSVRAQVVVDRARRAAAGTIAERGLARASGADPSLSRGTVSVVPRALRISPAGELGDAGLDRFLSERLRSVTGRVLHAECGDGSLVRRLAASGLEATGADPRTGDNKSRRGALEALSATAKGELGAVVLSGVPDNVTPASARALVRLAAESLQGRGALVLLSKSPGPLNEADPVSADLSPGRSLHPVTWCHLLARLGFGDIAVRESTDGSAYAVGALRLDRQP